MHYKTSKCQRAGRRTGIHHTKKRRASKALLKDTSNQDLQSKADCLLAKTKYAKCRKKKECKMLAMLACVEAVPRAEKKSYVMCQVSMRTLTRLGVFSR